MSFTPKLVLIRHAHRDTSFRSLDNGLSEKGKAQAEKLKSHAIARFSEKPPANLQILSSAKTRCQETLEPIAKAWNVPVKIDPLLIEQESHESTQDFYARIEEFLSRWRKNPPSLLLACSHGDWIPLASHFLVGVEIDPKKGSWMEFILQDGKAHLSQYLAFCI